MPREQKKKIASMGYSKDFYDKNKSAIDGYYQQPTHLPSSRLWRVLFKIAFENEDGDMEERLMPNSLDRKRMITYLILPEKGWDN
jgi:hypothetical protein